MDKKRIAKIIQRFILVLKNKGIRVDKIILYGSCAENRHHDGSDIDLVVISKSFKNKSYWQRINILSYAIYKIFEPIEAIAMTPDEWKKGDTLIHHFARKGKIVNG